MQITEELFKIVGAFEAQGLEYAVCGGLAVAIHGRPRLTVDIDILVAAEDISHAVQAAESVGYDDISGWVPLPPSTLGINRLFRLKKFSQNEFLSLDLLEADSSSNSILADRQKFDVDGKAIQSLTRNALIKMKLDSNRTKDRLDVELLNDQAE